MYPWGRRRDADVDVVDGAEIRVVLHPDRARERRACVGNVEPAWKEAVVLITPVASSSARPIFPCASTVSVSQTCTSPSAAIRVCGAGTKFLGDRGPRRDRRRCDRHDGRPTRTRRCPCRRRPSRGATCAARGIRGRELVAGEVLHPHPKRERAAVTRDVRDRDARGRPEFASARAACASSSEAGGPYPAHAPQRGRAASSRSRPRTCAGRSATAASAGSAVASRWRS